MKCRDKECLSALGFPFKSSFCKVCAAAIRLIKSLCFVLAEQIKLKNIKYTTFSRVNPLDMKFFYDDIMAHKFVGNSKTSYST